MDYNSFDFDNIRVEVRNLTVFHVIHMIETKRINLFPDFQRNLIWDITRNSKLIESLILNVPLPLFYLSENKEGIWDVVDGMQRLNAIWSFNRNDFRLKGLVYLQELNNLTMQELPLKFKQRILNFSLTFHVIDSRTPVDARFEIFRRINTEGVALNAQEIRNSYLTPRVRNFINELAENNRFNKLVPFDKNHRMERQELIIRFLAFYETYDFKAGHLSFRGGLSEFLDRFTQYLNDIKESKLEEYNYLFENAMKNVESLFGQYAFHRLYVDHESDLKISTFSKSLFISQSVILANYSLDYQMYKWNKEVITIEILEIIKKNKDICKTMNAKASSPRELQYQFLLISQMIEELISNVKRY